MKSKRGRKAQVTLFVIIALLLVGGILVYLLFIRKSVTPSPQDFTDPQRFIDSCVKDVTEEAIDIMLPQAGYLSPRNYKLYEDNKVAYLCYTSKFYETCINQEPLYLKHLEDEIKGYIEPKVKDCFVQLRQDLERRNYGIDERSLEMGVSLEPRKVRVGIKKYFKMTKGDESREFSDFSSTVSSPLYDLAVIAQEIASQEARFCNFEYVGYMILNKEVDIEKKAVGGGETASKIYIIGDRVSGKKLTIAIRSCAIPPGF